MAIFTLVLSVMMLVSTGLSAVSPAKGKKLQTALKEVTVDPEQEYECLLFRLEDKLDRTNEKIARIERELRKKRTGKATRYAFSAYLSDKNALYTNGNLKFIEPISNVGGAYNKHTGVFTSAVDGVYVFHFHATTYSRAKHCTLTLLHGNKIVTSDYDYDSYGFSSLGNSAVIEMKKAEVVYVSVTSTIASSSCYLRGRFTTFSGFKLS